MLASGACATIAEPDKVGLYYYKGSEDGYKFGFCIEPGTTGKWDSNNEVVFLPTSLRTWNIGGPGSDSGEPIISSSQPQEGQPSGVELQVWPKVTFFLNTYCDKEGGVVRQFWETLGRRNAADTDDGWKKMLQDVVAAALGKVTRDVTRGYAADALVGNIGGINAEVQSKIAAQFAVELKRMSGGDFFCGPGFNRSRPECPPIEVIIKDVTFNDPGIQAARNEKQKAVELAAAKLATAQGEAAALVAEAQGKKDAAAALAGLYNSPGWVQLQMQILQLEAVRACSEKPSCQMMIGGTGQIFSVR
jgi:SPFH domain/Band 7 family protein